MHSFEYTFLSWHNFSITKEIKENSNLGTINLLNNAKTIFLITIIDIFIHINIRKTYAKINFILSIFTIYIDMKAECKS